MAAAVTNGGGFGFLAAGAFTVIAVMRTRIYFCLWKGYDSEEKFTGEISAARAALTQPSHKSIPIGIGFLAWQLESHMEKQEKEPKSSGPLDLLRLALESRVQAVWFAFGENVGQWVEHVRKYDADRGDGHKTIVFVQIFSNADARTATSDWNADVIVAQGPQISSLFSYLVFQISRWQEMNRVDTGMAPLLLYLHCSLLSSHPRKKTGHPSWLQEA